MRCGGIAENAESFGQIKVTARCGSAGDHTLLK